MVKLAEQIEMANAELAGKTFERMKRAWVTENGERKRVERPARIKKWWSKDAAGNAFLRIFYGSKPVELQKGGKIAIEVGAMEKLPGILKAVKDAIVAGELDAEIGLIARDRAPKKKLKVA